MIKKEFMNSVTNGQQIDYCVIGNLAVNAYVEPVVNLDLDLVVVAEKNRGFARSSRKDFYCKKIPS